MNYVLAGGGTGGHINPAIAIAKEIQKRDPEAKLLFIGTDDGMESSLVPREGFDIAFIKVRGFSRAHGIRGLHRNAANAYMAFKASVEAKGIIKKFGADVVIGTGGYVSGPAVLGAKFAGVPSVVHEQNAFAGVTTRMVSKYAARVLLSFERTIGLQDRRNTVVTGNPVRESLLLADRDAARARLGLDERPMILSYGGSLGAREVNTAVAYVLSRSQQDGLFQHIHATGSIDRKRAMGLLDEYGVRTDGSTGITVTEYIYNMDECIAACDMLITRSGAITLAELTCLGKPAILIPSPNVTENHQYHNACVLRDAGAAVMIEEKDLTGEKLYETLLEIACDSGVMREMGRRSRDLAHMRAAQRIVDEIEAVCALRKNA